MAQINFIATYKLVGVGEELDGERTQPAADGRGRLIRALRGDEALGAAADLVPALVGARAALQGAGDDHAVVAVRPHAVRAVSAALILNPTQHLLLSVCNLLYFCLTPVYPFISDVLPEGVGLHSN